MKYIKTYEGYPDNIEFYCLKKYAICKSKLRGVMNSKDDDYMIFELIKSAGNFSIIVKKLEFSKLNNNVTKSTEIPISISIIRDNMIFQSDDINEIKEKLEILQEIDIYNL